MCMEFTNNSTSSKRVLLPLELDFSNMSDPSVVVEPPHNNWRSDDRQVSQTSRSGRISKRDQSRNKHKSKKKRSRKSKRSKHSNKKMRRRYTSSSSSSLSDNQSHDYGRYKRSRHSPRTAQNPSILQPVEITNVQTIPQPEQTLQRSTKDSGSESEIETWSFDRAINEVFGLLPLELCPRPTEEHVTPLLVLPQSKLVENTARFLQSKIDTEKCGRDCICSQNLVSSLTQTKFYKSQSQYFPTDNIPPLELEVSLLDLSSKRKYSIPMKNIEIWEKRTCKLIAINSHVDLFSSAAYLCMQQQTMSVPALSRLLEAVAKSVKHATAMSTILATEIFQTRHDAVLATS